MSASPSRGTFVFVDLNPEANWGHPTLYVFVSLDGEQVQVVRREFPPYSGAYPASFRTFTLEVA